MTGLTSLHARSRPGIVSTRTNALLVKVIGKIRVKANAWTFSTTVTYATDIPPSPPAARARA
ncbi:hypothetical protein [Streptomyces sp. NPDC005407]|uniref:hypothetical protein n=1 Tax=Streptomyces sp. NPDC005407 TaxID=3155340 RepID=UPI0033B86365